MSPNSNRSRTFLCGLLLAVATLVLYWPATHFDFVNYDDDIYVFNNPQVRGGLGWYNLKWALANTSAANWHPLTWISHTADYAIFGSSAGGHHFTSLALHSANTLLLFLVLTRLTASLWPCIVVAAFFGWHPLHVESVAWVSERKDVLSTLFWMLSLGAYARYAEEFKAGRADFKKHYAAAVILFALGLMCKPMVVTLPFVFLLLDYWPLQRSPAALRAWGPLLLEKAPFFALAGAACVVTIVAQHSGGAIKTLNQVPFAARACQVPVAYASYVCKTLWPAQLCGFYPLPAKPPILAAACALAALAGMTILAWRWRRAYPWVIVGWFWFLGTLVPVIGLLQAGRPGDGRPLYLCSIHWPVYHGCLECRPLAGAAPGRARLGRGGCRGVLARLCVCHAEAVGDMARQHRVLRSNPLCQQDLRDGPKRPRLGALAGGPGQRGH